MEKKEFCVMVINPGSTHDEVAVYRGETELFNQSIPYSIDDLKPYEEKNVTSQFQYRKDHIKRALKEKGISLDQIDAAIGRGGLLHPLPGGVFRVTQEMIDDLVDAKYGDHPCNLGAILANAVGKTFGKPAFIADSVVVDEMWPLAKYSGRPEIPRKSIFHCLNQKRVGRMAAAELGKDYNDCRLIVMHAGGGITIGAHVGGRIVDVNNGLDGEGPFTPQRAGTLEAGGVARLCFSGKYTLEDIKIMLSRKGGLRVHLGTSDIKVIKKYIKGEPLPDKHNLLIDKITPQKAKEVLEAMCYQAGKYVGGLAAALKGRVEAIVLTGGVMYDDEFCQPWVKQYVEWIAPVFVYPGGGEMLALRDAAFRVLNNEEEALIYKA